MNVKKLIVGDFIAIALATVIGFITHGEMGAAYLSRMAASFFPVLLIWFLLAPWFGLFNDDVAANKKLIWRVPLAMLFVAPLAVMLRAAFLHVAVQATFALVLGSANAFALALWRFAYAWRMGRK